MCRLLNGVEGLGQGQHAFGAEEEPKLTTGSGYRGKVEPHGQLQPQGTNRAN